MGWSSAPTATSTWARATPATRPRRDDPASLAGKVLRIDVFGRPIGADPVFTRGHRDVTAICPHGDLSMYATDEGDDGPDELNLLSGGSDYGPRGTAPVAEILARGGRPRRLRDDRRRWPSSAPSTASGCTCCRSRSPRTARSRTDPEELLGGQYGRLRTVVADAEGALWITTSNRDGIGTPGEGDDKVLRILPPNSGAESPL